MRGGGGALQFDLIKRDGNDIFLSRAIPPLEHKGEELTGGKQRALTTKKGEKLIKVQPNEEVGRTTNFYRVPTQSKGRKPASRNGSWRKKVQERSKGGK